MMSPRGSALLAGGFVLGWATCLAQGLWGNKFSHSGQSWEKERVPDGGVPGESNWSDIVPTDDGRPSIWWTHELGSRTHITRRGEACRHCGATEDGA